MPEEVKAEEEKKKRIFSIYIFGKEIGGSVILVMVIIPFLVSLCANITYDWCKNSDWYKEKHPGVTLESLQASIEDINGRVEKLENGTTSQPSVSIEGNNNEVSFGKLKLISDDMLDVEQESKELAFLFAAPKWESKDRIFINSETGEKYTAGQVVNQEILLTYRNNNEEIYFLGQFNENNHWNDECLINVYENNILKSIMEANYDDGELTTYRQVVKTQTAHKTDVWSISDKEHKENYNSGITENYIYFDYAQEVEFENADKEDMIRIDAFKNTIKEASVLEGYYCGNTSGGYYNDDTGDAYLAKYYEDGTIRLLYHGRFKNGYPQDLENSKETWEIVYAEQYEFYVQNVGNHTKGQADHKSHTPISIEEINEIVSKYDFKCDLKWRESQSIDRKAQE